MYKPTVVFDFDGVIHRYDSKWSGVENISDGPVDGIKEAITEIRKEYEVVIVSTRSADIEGMEAIQSWLMFYGIEVDRICSEKPPAIVYIDDRAITFDGDPSTLLAKIKAFKPWNKTNIGGNLKVEKMLDISEVKQAKDNITDLKIYGDGDTFALLCKASSQEQGWMKSTKVCNVPGGCIVQVTTQQRNTDGSYAVAEALTYVPNVQMCTNQEPRILVPIKDVNCVKCQCK